MLQKTFSLYFRVTSSDGVATSEDGSLLEGGSKHDQSAHTQRALCVFQVEQEFTILGDNCYHFSAQIYSVHSLNRIIDHAEKHRYFLLCKSAKTL